MNDLIDRDGDLEFRVEKIEKDVNHLLKQAQAHGLDLKQVQAMLGRVQFDTGDAREGLDTVERRQAEALKQLRAIGQTQVDHDERLDTLARGQQELKQDLSAVFDGLVKHVQDEAHEIKTTQAGHSERFDMVERVLGTVQADISGLKTDVSS